MIFYVMLVLAMSAGTWLLGWWGVALLAAIGAYVLRSQSAVTWKVALSAAGAWTALLIVDAISGPLSLTATTLGRVMAIPGPALLVVTVLFPALIAWSAATVVTILVKRG